METRASTTFTPKVFRVLASKEIQKDRASSETTSMNLLLMRLSQDPSLFPEEEAVLLSQLTKTYSAKISRYLEENSLSTRPQASPASKTPQ